jgi:hypothetical protein
VRVCPRRAAAQLALEDAAAADDAAHQLHGVGQARREGRRPVQFTLTRRMRPDVPSFGTWPQQYSTR